MITVIKVVVVLAVALIVTAVAVLMSLDFGSYRGEIAEAVREATGRRLAVDGNFSLRIGFKPTVEVERVRFANASWGSRPEMVTIEKFRIEVKLLPLLLGNVRVERLVLEGADILLETDAGGRGNWMFGAADVPVEAGPALPGSAAPPLSHFDRVRVERARIVWRDGRSGKADEVTVNALEAASDGTDNPVRFALRAVYAGMPANVDGTLGSLARLYRGTSPWPFDIAAEVGGTTLAMNGSARHLLAGTGVEALLAVRGDDLSKLGALSGVALPVIGPYRLEARLSDSGRHWTVGNLTIVVGRSNVAGEASVDLSAAPPKLRATLTSPLVDLADFRDRAPASGETHTPAPPSPGPAKETADGRLFPDTPLSLDALATVDAEVRLRAARVLVGTVTLADAAADLRIKDGALVLHPFTGSLAGTPLAAEASLAVGTEPTLSARLRVDRIDLAAFLKETGNEGLATGLLDVRAALTGSGKSVRALMAGLNGTAEIVMGEGTVADDTLHLLSADVISAIAPWAPADRDLKVNCMIGRYDIRAGMVTSQATLFDSDRVALTGEGGVNLATEQIGFTVIPYAKEASLLRLAVPIHVGGTLAEPRAWPDAERMAKGAVGTVLNLPGDVLGVVGDVLRGDGIGDRPANDRCIAALKTDGASGPTPAKPSDRPAGGVGRALEDIGKGIGDGLKNLFGR